MNVPREMDENVFRYSIKLGSGAIAGIVGATAVFPLDLVKTRLQVSPIKQSPIEIASQIIRTRGIFGLYSGLTANLIGITPEKAIKLVANDGLREIFAEYSGFSTNNLPNIYGALAGGGAGLAQFIVTCPMEIVKIKMQLPDSKKLFEVAQELGFRGMYRGGAATLLRDIPFSMILFQTNAVLKEKLKRSSEADAQTVLMAGIYAGAIAAFAVTPLDVIKTRIQAGRAISISDSFWQVAQEAGIRGFFRGSIQRMAIVSPLFGISLAVYEVQQRLFFK